MLKPTTLAMILAGGRVDELNVLTYYRPKSALPFGGFGRVIDFALSNLMNSGIERVAILSQYRSYSLINHIGTGAAWDMLGRNRGISILPPYIGSDQTNWYRGSADAVYRNIDFVQYYEPEQILILSGDHIYKMDYQHLIAYHREKDADLTMGVIRVRPDQAHRFGIAALDDEDGERGGRVTSYWEKPKEPESDWASLTVLCFKPEVMYRLLNENQNDASFEFGRDIIPRLMKAGGRVYAYKFCGYWGYTRTIEEYWQSNMDLLGRDPCIDMEKWGFRTNLDHRGIRDFQPVVIGDDATVHDSLVYNGSVIDGTVRRSIIFPGVSVEKGAVVEDSVLFFNNHIGRNCRLSKVVADVNNTFGEGVVVGAEAGRQAEAVTVVGWNNIVPNQVVIGEGATVYPLLGSGRWKKVIAAGEVLR
ncbi:glucose-1-phosphate adenylyltransferase [Desulfoprunum benzoelyticum]|uniref:Glucose-1-phosphate adenylyltransferase n=2 Tax=Desulfoprunum benzoelyticum TaxID=1506996 RepID=A0A840V5L9_9BACT|nr:sugar phosphate nucleotidyltransferase [Desulfoprunum benzoelyticum]MBB5348361.1 glucose-1-phosphate adenylyltransferase [Desulfoprunum benzoelyticum]MBM9528779.1 glucose-1-phosphate adenylyltransferase [Desulfoprunum benzoelyticum]